MQTKRKTWFRRLPWKIIGAISGALLILIVVFALAPSDNLWLETKRALEARGELLDWEKVIPPEVRPADNFFEHPVAASLLPIKGQAIPENPLGVDAPQLPQGSTHLGYPFLMSNLLALPREAGNTNELSLTQLHDWFAQWDESFAQLREAAKRPHARVPGDYTSPMEVPIQNFVAARQLAQVLGSRANVHLLLGNPSASFEDLETLSVVMKSMEAKPPTLVSTMIHVAMAGIYLETVDQGLQHNLWAEPEMRRIVARLREMNLLALLEQGIRSERFFVIRILEALANRRRDPLYAGTLKGLTPDNWNFERFVVQFSPPSWIRRNQARYALLIQRYLDAIDPLTRTINQRQITSAETELATLQSSRSPKDVLTRYLIPNFSKAATTAARNQAQADRLAVALALELFRSRRGSYPAALQQLVPEFIVSLPHDLDTGKPIVYQLTTSGYELVVKNARFTHPTISGGIIPQAN